MNYIWGRGGIYCRFYILDYLEYVILTSSPSPSSVGFHIRLRIPEPPQIPIRDPRESNIQSRKEVSRWLRDRRMWRAVSEKGNILLSPFVLALSVVVGEANGRMGHRD